MKLLAAAGIADEGFHKEHGGTGDIRCGDHDHPDAGDLGICP